MHFYFLTMYQDSYSISIGFIQQAILLMIYSNPVRNGLIHLAGYGLEDLSNVEIFSMDGKLLQTLKQNLKSSSKIILNNVTKGFYIL